MTEVRKRSRVPKPMAIVGLAMVAIAIIASFAASFVGAPNQQVVAAATNAPAEPRPTNESVVCAPEFTQVAIDRTVTTQVDPRYADEFALIWHNADLTHEEKIEAIRDLDLMVAGTNAQTLAFLAFQANIWDDPNDWVDLVEGGEIVEGGCLSEAGRLVFSELKGVYGALELTIQEAPDDWSNSGIVNGVAVVDHRGGIRGDLTATVYSNENGEPVLVQLVRCKNPLWPEPPEGPPDCPEDECLEPKDPQKDPSPPDGVDPIADPGPLTDGDESEDQQDSGDVDGNVIDDPVDGDTGSGDTTPETDVDVPGANPGGDDQSDDVVDPDVIVQDPGGTDGGTEISVPSD